VATIYFYAFGETAQKEHITGNLQSAGVAGKKGVLGEIN
jgi:hypothetical protein